MKKIIIILCTLLSALITLAEVNLTTHINEVENGYNYWFYIPDTTCIDTSDNITMDGDTIPVIVADTLAFPTDSFVISSYIEDIVTDSSVVAAYFEAIAADSLAIDSYFNALEGDSLYIDDVTLLPDTVEFVASDALERAEMDIACNENHLEMLEDDAIAQRKKKPLIVFLHGQSLCGTDINKVMRYGTADAVKRGREIDAFIIAPQNPGGVWNPDRLINIIDHVTELYPIDTNRIYVLGMSLGGFGTIDLVAAYPERIAAAMALCGGGTTKDFSGLNQVPLWIIHGTADRDVSVRESRHVKAGMEKCGDTPLLRYDEWKGVNHSRLARLFYLPEVYEWLFKHSLTDTPRQVDKEIKIYNTSLNNVYKGLKYTPRKRRR